ncbi:peptide chain release factor N(5)-glutamine methyltransferase [Gordonia sp. NPDC003425]
MTAAPVSAELRRATADLAAAGIDSARADAEWLMAHVLGVDRGLLLMADDLDDTALRRYRDLIERRSRREPLQHLTGRAAFGPVDLAVGPGVFVPRPETEFLLEWACRALARIDAPAVADLCSGSGALALSIAAAVPGARVAAVETDPRALRWLRRNVEAGDLGDRVTVIAADATDEAAVTGHIADGSLDLVVANPPYVPAAAQVSPEVAADPAHAVFAGGDGMAVITPMAGVIATILRPGGRVGIEHDESTSRQVVEVLDATGAYDEIIAHRDLADRPRFVTARRRRTDGPDRPPTRA